MWIMPPTDEIEVAQPSMSIPPAAMPDSWGLTSVDWGSPPELDWPFGQVPQSQWTGTVSGFTTDKDISPESTIPVRSSITPLPAGAKLGWIDGSSSSSRPDYAGDETWITIDDHIIRHIGPGGIKYETPIGCCGLYAIVSYLGVDAKGHVKKFGYNPEIELEVTCWTELPF